MRAQRQMVSVVVVVVLLMVVVVVLMVQEGIGSDGWEEIEEEEGDEVFAIGFSVAAGNASPSPSSSSSSSSPCRSCSSPSDVVVCAGAR